MGLPFSPEPEESIVARYHEALRPEIDVLHVAGHPEETPWKFRKHVFDFPDGIRMIASVDKAPGLHALHLSFSLDGGFAWIYNPDTLMQRILALCEKFSGCKKKSRVKCLISPGGVAHFYFAKLPVWKENETTP